MPAARARTRSRHGAVAGAALLAGAVLITLWAQATLHARVAPAAARSVPAATLRVDAHAPERLLDERGLPRRQPFLAADAARGVGGSGRPARARWGCESYWDEASNASVPRCAPSGRDGATRCLPGVIGIGPTKTGTSTLRDWLKVPVNAAVRIADGEPRFFNDPDTVLPNFFAEGLRSYRRRMPALNSSDDVDGLTIVEKSPHYFNFLSARVQDGAPARAARMCASMGLLVIVRDPVERAVSNYAMRVYEHENGRVKGPKPNEFEGEVLLPDGTVNEAHTYVQAGLYQVRNARAGSGGMRMSAEMRPACCNGCFCLARAAAPRATLTKEALRSSSQPRPLALGARTCRTTCFDGLSISRASSSSSWTLTSSASGRTNRCTASRAFWKWRRP